MLFEVLNVIVAVAPDLVPDEQADMTECCQCLCELVDRARGARVDQEFDDLRIAIEPTAIIGMDDEQAIQALTKFGEMTCLLRQGGEFLRLTE